MFRRTLILVLSIGWLYQAAEGAERCAEPAAKVLSAEGPLEVRYDAVPQWQPIDIGQTLCPGDMVRVGRYGRAALRLPDQTVLRLGHHTTLRFPAATPTETTWLELLRGALHTITRTPRQLEIRTPYVNAAVEGTEFALIVGDDHTRLQVVEGKVRASNVAGTVRAEAGTELVATADAPPRQVATAQLQDAVQWALYYPPVLSPSRAVSQQTAALSNAQRWMERGDPAAALRALDQLPRAAHGQEYYLYRASILLHLGQVESARAALAQVDRTAPDNADARALRAVIALTQGDKEQSLALAQAAVQQAPSSPAPWLALSYAQQAHFSLQEALRSAQRAVELQPDRALAHARVAELQLALGHPRAARASARAAVQRNPYTSRTQTVLGFSHLLDGDVSAAQVQFKQAISLDQGDPLPRLGQGLARIRAGDLQGGREDLETAVALDPSASLLRSYLGKAYFEEKRDRLANNQYQLAKQLDPNDPTPWLYAALLNQVDNQPAAALQNLQASSDRNDNRAVFSSRLALDQDSAARSAARARIYQELGFTQRAEREASEAINDDPSNAAAHRFLAEAYSNRPGYELARASEALQSQLLQPLSLNPVPPSLSETDLNILRGAGPSAARLNVYDPLFVRNQTVLRGVGVAGTQGTRGDELVYAGIADRTAWSIGQFHYQTDGFRPNNQSETDVYNAFVQTNLTGRDSLQAEVRSRDESYGDIALRFDPDNYSDSLHHDREEDTARLGYHHIIQPGQDFIASLIYQRVRVDQQGDTALSPLGPFGPLTLSEQQSVEGKTVAAEAQYIAQHSEQRYILGGGYYRNDIETELEFQVTSGPIMLTSSNTIEDLREHGYNAHAYTYWNLAESVAATFGLTADSVRSGVLDERQINPKLGMQWRLTPGVSVRAAAFRTLKRELAANQTVEPTQVAGFNQFFDEPTGTDALNYGLGLDWRFGAQTYTGIELFARELEVPVKTGSTTSTEDQQQRNLRAYAYTVLTPSWSLGADVFYERFSRDTAPLNQPSELRTWRAPVALTYHHKNGFFGSVIPTFYSQDAVLPGSSNQHDRFWLVNTQVGYQLPKRLGFIALEVRNLFDTGFNYYDAEFQSGLDRPPTIQPERALLVRIAISLD